MKHLLRGLLLGVMAGMSSSIAFAQGTHHGGGERDHEVAHAAAAGGDLPLVEAEVRRVNTRANTLSVRHGDIPNLDMPPMTMTFRLADPELLEGLSVGDNILVTVDRIDGAYTVMSVEPVQ